MSPKLKGQASQLSHAHHAEEEEEEEEDLDWEEDEPHGPRSPVHEEPEVIVLSERSVIIRVDDFYICHKMTSNIDLNKVRPPAVPPVKRDVMVEPREKPCKVTKNFNFSHYTFKMVEMMVSVNSLDGNQRQHLHGQFSIHLNDKVEMLCAKGKSPGTARVELDPLVYGSEWRLHGLGKHTYLFESVLFKGWCLALGRFGLQLERMSQRDWVRLEKGECDKHRRVTVTTIPDFAVTTPGAMVY